MPRARRPLEAGLLYHLIGRGVEGRATFADDHDHETFLGLLDDEVRRRGWEVHTACLMPNHFHLVTRTPEADLHLGMHRLMGEHARRFNDRHARTGHRWGDRYKSIVVRDDGHHLALFRYVALNPVPSVVGDPLVHPWSAHAALAGRRPAPPWLSFAGRDACFGGPERYAAFAIGGEAGRDLLDELLETSRTPLQSAISAGFTQAEVAARLGIPRSKVERLLREARRTSAA